MNPGSIQKIKIREKKLNESQDNLTLVNYKEPLVKIKKGYGYYGALLSTLDGEGIQCHICGGLFKDAGRHILQAHRMRLRDYREKFQLAFKTSLISEKERQRRKERTLAWLKTLSEEEREEYRKKGIENLKRWWRKMRGKRRQPTLQLETMNKRGTCPTQLIEKIKEVKEEIGHTPSLHEFVGETRTQRYKHLIFKVYGSWKNALKIANLVPKEQDKGGYKTYKSEELLEYLNIFAQENRKVPTSTDFRRGLLPSYSIYKHRFGSIENARQLAGVYNFIEKSTLRGYKG